MSNRVKHPILRLEVIGADGSRSSDHRVYCRHRRTAVSVESCCGCVHCDEITGGDEPSVRCSIPSHPLDHQDDPAGERVDVGALLRVGPVVVRQSAPLGAALDLIAYDSRHSVAVVDDTNALVGIIHEADLAAHPGRWAHAETASDVMSGRHVTVDERTPVRVALRVLAAHHLREVTVITSEGVPLGVFRDVDGLRWIADFDDPPATPGLSRASSRRRGPP